MIEIVTQPEFIAHADWGTNPKKCQVASAELTNAGTYRIFSLSPADPISVASGDLRSALHVPSPTARLLAGFDFPIGLPYTYAERAEIIFFPDLLPLLGRPPWVHFYDVATMPSEISLHRPFYPFRPGGTSRSQLTEGLDLTWQELRRRCDGTDAETMFWTLGGKQVGKAALGGWKFLAAAPPGSLHLWPFEGTLEDLLGDEGAAVVAETYPREFYRCIRPRSAGAGARSKRRQEDRLQWMPRLLEWADELGAVWDADVRQRVEAGFSSGVNGEDEFDAVVGLLGMIAVLRGDVGPGEPRDDPGVVKTEGWILGRQSDDMDEVSARTSEGEAAGRWVPFSWPSQGPPAPSVADALGHVIVWTYALSVQTERVEARGEGGFAGLTREIDCRFYIVALRNLLRAAELVGARAEQNARIQIQAAIDRFEAAVPGARAIRDRLEHFDEYESGRGNEQKKARIVEPSRTWFVRGHEKVRTYGHEKSAPVATRSPQLWPSDVLTPR